MTKGCDGGKGLLSLDVLTDPESASVLDASAPAAASDAAASAPAWAASAGCNTKVIQVGLCSLQLHVCTEKCSSVCPSALSCWLLPSADKQVRNLRLLLGFCLPLSLQPTEITVKSAFPHSSHAAGNTPEEINETPKILCTSFFSRSKSQTYFTLAQYLLLHIDCPLVCEYKSACMPKDKDL